MEFDNIFFISCFLPLLLIIYRLVPGIRVKNWVLLVFSLIFYSFGNLTALLLLLGCCLANFCFGLVLRGSRGRKAAVIAGVCLNLAMLGIYKYLDFFLAQVLLQPQLTVGLAAPLGISFFTFKSISYLIDAYRDPDQASKSLPDLMLYICFFPQIVTGPITRFSDFAPQFGQRQSTLEGLGKGLRRFIAGLAKKLILAGTLGSMVDSVFTLEAGVLDARLAWLGAIGYCLQLYFDFSGYIDMAIGLGGCFGFKTVENFNMPYLAPTIGNFWRRWHISLSAWFKDYVYIPLGGNRKGKIRAGINKAAVFLLCGLWHGASWTFVVWGLWHGLFSMLESMNIIPAKKLEKSRVLGHIYTLLVVCLGFVMFRSGTLSQGLTMIGTMFTGFSFTRAGTVALHSLLTGQTLVTLALSVLLCLPVCKWLTSSQNLCKALEPVSYALVLLLFVLCLITLAAGDFAPSIYAQF